MTKPSSRISIDACVLRLKSRGKHRVDASLLRLKLRLVACILRLQILKASDPLLSSRIREWTSLLLTVDIWILEPLVRELILWLPEASLLGHNTIAGLTEIMASSCKTRRLWLDLLLGELLLLKEVLLLLLLLLDTLLIHIIQTLTRGSYLVLILWLVTGQLRLQRRRCEVAVLWSVLRR